MPEVSFAKDFQVRLELDNPSPIIRMINGFEEISGNLIFMDLICKLKVDDLHFKIVQAKMHSKRSSFEKNEIS